MDLVHAAIAGTDEQKRKGVEFTARAPNGHGPYIQPLENEQNV